MAATAMGENAGDNYEGRHAGIVVVVVVKGLTGSIATTTTKTKNNDNGPLFLHRRAVARRNTNLNNAHNSSQKRASCTGNNQPHAASRWQADTRSITVVSEVSCTPKTTRAMIAKMSERIHAFF